MRQNNLKPGKHGPNNNAQDGSSRENTVLQAPDPPRCGGMRLAEPLGPVSRQENWRGFCYSSRLQSWSWMGFLAQDPCPAWDASSTQLCSLEHHWGYGWSYASCKETHFFTLFLAIRRQNPKKNIQPQCSLLPPILHSDRSSL